MSRSFKKAIIKDHKDDTYWKRIRSRINQVVRQFKYEKINEEIFYMDNDCPEDTKVLDSEDTIPDPRVLINDYRYRDFWYLSDDEKTKRK